MNVRVVRGAEKRTLMRRPPQEWAGPTRVLDAEEQREIHHLYRTKQARPNEIAHRYGVSLRTVYRYLTTHPEAHAAEQAGRRVQTEAGRFGLMLNRDEALRLAAAALTEPV